MPRKPEPTDPGLTFHPRVDVPYRKRPPSGWPSLTHSIDVPTLTHAAALDAGYWGRRWDQNIVDSKNPALFAIELAFEAGAVAESVEHLRLTSPDAAEALRVHARDLLSFAYANALGALYPRKPAPKSTAKRGRKPAP